MNIVKTALIIIIVLVIVSLLAYVLPTEKLLSYIPYLNQIYNNTSLTVNSKNGKSNVVINGRDYGQTPVTISDLNPGQIDVILTKVPENKDIYSPIEVNVSLEKGTESIIDMEIGPGGVKSGYILYYTKSLISSDNKGLVTLISTPKESVVYLDELVLGKSPINANKLSAKEFKVKIVKEGYEDLSFPVIVRNGFNLNVQAYLYPLPTLLKNE